MAACACPSPIGLNIVVVTCLGLAYRVHDIEFPDSNISLLHTSMMPSDIDEDEYAAKLLAQDAKKSTKTYDLVGLDAFNPKRCVGRL